MRLSVFAYRHGRLVQANGMACILMILGLIGLLLCVVNHSSAFLDAVLDKHYSFISLGDLNIGGILSIHGRTHHGEDAKCAESIIDIRLLHHANALKYAVNAINKRSDILSNITLGYVILDDCLLTNVALARAMQFMPPGFRNYDCCDIARNVSNARNNGTFQDGLRNSSTSHQRRLVYYDVVGVVGTLTSKMSRVVANVLSLFQIPQISHTATTDLFSDKHQFPYFMRVVLPDRFQANALADVLSHFNWSYVSLVYSDGDYGHNGVKRLRRALQEHEICIATTIEIDMDMTDNKLDGALLKLRKHRNARVVVVYSGMEYGSALLQAILRNNMATEFVWIGSDGFAHSLKHLQIYHGATITSLCIQPFAESSYIQFIDLDTFNGSPSDSHKSNSHLKKDGFVTARPPTRKCQFMGTTNCQRNPSYDADSSATAVVDIVYAFAHALDTVRKKYCPHAMAHNIRVCITGPKLLYALKHTSFTGLSGQIAFDDNGDIYGKYEVAQHRQTDIAGKFDLFPVGVWDRKTKGLEIGGVEWPSGSGYISGSQTAQGVITMTDKADNGVAVQQKLVEASSRLGNYSISNATGITIDNGGSERGSHNTVPVSTCGEACRLGEIYYFPKETCCWQCRICNDNEIVGFNQTLCEECPAFYWPDGNTRSACVRIIPESITYKDVVGIILCCLSSFGFLVTIITSGIYYQHRNDRIIRSTSRELSYVMLFGIGLSFCLVFSFLAPPTQNMCYLDFVGSSLTVTTVYAPLLMRTNRIYRIFRAGRKTKALPRCTSPSSQIAIVIVVIAIQILLVTITVLLAPPTVQIRMPIRSQKFVEVFCNMPLVGMIPTVTYNLLLVLVCTFYAFKTRKLPDNYNESRYIAFCVDTTVLIWIAFIPTYFTASKACYRMMILSAAVILQAIINIICLFVPKIHTLIQSKLNPDTISNFTGSQQLMMLQKALLNNANGSISVGGRESCSQFHSGRSIEELEITDIMMETPTEYDSKNSVLAKCGRVLNQTD